MDKMILGTNSVSEIIDLYSLSKNIFKAPSMNLRKWMTSSTEVYMVIPENVDRWLDMV